MKLASFTGLTREISFTLFAQRKRAAAARYNALWFLY
jgi:hypothetical protein